MVSKEDPVTETFLVQGAFERLPTELICNILSDPVITKADLYNLATLSRRLNSLAITKYLERCDTSHCTPSFMRVELGVWRGDQPTSDLLAGFAIDLDLKRLLSLSVSISSVPQHGIPESRKKNIRQLTRIANRMDSISQFTLLEFEDSSKTLNLDTHIDFWHSCLYELLDTVAGKGCTDFQFHNGNRALDPSQLGHLTKGSHVSARIANRTQWKPDPGDPLGFHGPDWPKARPQDRLSIKSSGIQYKSSPSAEAEHRARPSQYIDLQMEAGYFLLPPYFNWLISIMQGSNCVKQLTLSDCDFKVKIWPYVLPYFAKALPPYLTHLTFSRYSSGITAHEILSFVSSLRSLEYLVIDHSFSQAVTSDVRSTSTSLSIPELPHLRRLKAPSFFVSHLFQIPLDIDAPPSVPSATPSQTRVFLPVLEELVVTSDLDPYGRPLEYYSEISQKWNTFIERALQPDWRHSFRVCLNLEDSTPIDLRAIQQGSEPPVDSTVSQDSNGPSFKCIESVHLPTILTSNPKDLEPLFRSFASLFADVSDVTITRWPPSVEFDFSHIRDELKTQMATFHRLCPNVRTLNIWGYIIAFSGEGEPEAQGFVTGKYGSMFSSL